MEDQYTLIDSYETPRAIVRVYRPVLSEEEYQRRHRILYLAAESLLKSYYNSKSEE